MRGMGQAQYPSLSIFSHTCHSFAKTGLDSLYLKENVHLKAEYSSHKWYHLRNIYNFVDWLQWVPTHVEVMLVSWKLLLSCMCNGFGYTVDDYYEEVKVVNWTLSQQLITNLFRKPLCILESSFNNLLYSDRVTLITVASIALSRFTVRISNQT